MPEEVVGIGVEAEGFVGGGDFFKPGLDLVSAHEAIVACGKDECGDVEIAGESFAGVDEVAEFEEEAEAEIADVVGLFAEGILISAIARERGGDGLAVHEPARGESGPWKETCGKAKDVA